MKRWALITLALAAMGAVLVTGVALTGEAGTARGNTGYPRAKHVRATSVKYHTITIAWNAPTWSRSFGVWKNGVHVARTTRRSYTFRGLACDTAYRLGVRVRYAGGRTTRATTITVRTLSACPASVFVSTTGSDSAPCTKAAPCQSFSHAYQVARPGQIVEVAGGTYPSQTLDPPRKPAGSAMILFRHALGATVNVGEIRTNGVNAVEFRGMHFDDYYVAAASSRITFRNDTAHVFYIRSAHTIHLIGGSVGPSCDGESATVGAADQSSERSTEILIDGVRFHDITRACAPAGSHVECLFVQETTGITIERSSFANCDIMDIFFHRIGITGDPRNVVIRHNDLHASTGGGFYSMVFRADSGETLSNYFLKANIVRQDMLLENAPGSTVTRFRLCQNTGAGVLKVTGSAAGVTHGACG
jgi:hypothetical protein